MENKIILSTSFFLITLFMFTSCVMTKGTNRETPLMTVVKLISAEQNLKYNDAKQYMDVFQVYSQLGSKNPEEDWIKWITFNYNIAKDPKFTNQVDYSKYNIQEKITGKIAKVTLESKNDNSSIKSIEYILRKRQRNWIVISIKYLK